MAPLIHHVGALVARGVSLGAAVGAAIEEDKQRHKKPSKPLSTKSKIIIAVAIGAAVLISLPIIICCCIRSRRKKRQGAAAGHSTHEMWDADSVQQPSKAGGKPSAGNAGYQHDPEASHGLLSNASAPGHGNAGAHTDYSPRPSLSNRPVSYAGAPTPPIHVTGPAEYDGRLYGQGSSVPQQQQSQPLMAQAPPASTPSAGRRHSIIGGNGQGPLPLYLQQSHGGAADDYFAGRSPSAKEAMGQVGS